MDANKLRFAELFKQERRATKALVEALLEIHSKCENPNGDGKHDCDNCVFSIHKEFSGWYGKLILDDWLNTLKEK
jgi:hypothetical protein